MFKLKKVALVLVLILGLSTIPSNADYSSQDVSTATQFINVAKDASIVEIRLTSNIKVTDQHFDLKSDANEKIIELNGYKLEFEKNNLKLYINDSGNNTDHFRLTFKDSSATMSGRVEFKKKIDFNFQSVGLASVVFDGGTYTANSPDYILISSDTSGLKQGELIIKRGNFAGFLSLVRFNAFNSQTIKIQEYKFNAPSNKVANLVFGSGKTLEEIFDFNNYLLYIDDVLVPEEDYSNNADTTTGHEFRTEKIRILDISGLADNQIFTFDGTPHSPLGTLVVEENLVPVDELEVLYAGVGATSYDSIYPPTNAGTYMVTYSIPTSNPIYRGSVTYNFEILKANPSYDIPTDLEGIRTEELSSVLLPTGFTWEDDTTIMDVAGVETFLAVFTPTDTNNYLIITGIELDVDVKNKFHVNTSVVGNGTITAGSDVIEGETAIIEMTADANHYLKEVTVNGVVTPVTDNKLELVVTEDLDIVATFEIYTYQVTVLDYDKAGVSIDPDGIIHVPHGNHLSLEIIVKPGYKLVELLVNDVDRSADLISEVLTLSYVTEDHEVKVVVEPIVYPFISGENSIHIINKDPGITLVLDASLAPFVGIEVDDVLLDPNNYEAKDGSLIINLKKSYLDNLKPGEYQIAVLFDGGVRSVTGFSVKSAGLPGTGVNYVSPMISLLVISFGCFLVFKKKRKFN